MNLYILRHAIAVEPGSPAYEDDSQRPLTDRGAAKMKQIASGLRHMDVEFDLVLSSPHLRTRQTAEILAKSYDIPDKVIITPALLPEAPASQIINEINENYSRFNNVVLVGHQPYLNTLISMLISGDPTLNITLKKGGLCRLSVERLRYDRCAKLEWLIYPFQIISHARLD
ncbi:MAG: phosphohistidine phosphatase SixA [Anaerolineales bacterium]